MSKMNLKNARDPEQLRRMRALSDAGLCYFCRQGKEEDGTLAVALFEREYWYVKKNDYKATGAEHHYLIVLKHHETEACALLPEESSELFSVVSELKENLKVSGYSLFVRSGDTKITGATIDHIHFHFIVGGPKPENCTLQDALPIVLGFKKR